MRYRRNAASPYCALQVGALAVAGLAGACVSGESLIETGEVSGRRSVAVVAVKRRVGPVLDVCHQAVLDGVEPAVVDVAAQVPLVADQVLPIAALPDAALAADPPGRRERLAAWNG